MSKLIKVKRHYYTRLPLMALLIGLFAISPILISIIGPWIVEMRTGIPCHEGNCSWSAFGWLFLATFPLSGILSIILVLVVVKDTNELRRKYEQSSPY